MKRRLTVALCLLAVVAAAITAGTLGANNKAAASSITAPACGNDQTVKLPTLTGPISGGVKLRTARIGAFGSRSCPTW